MSKILIVEDNLGNMGFAATVLETAGHQILQAWNAEMGLQLAGEHLPDCIFMDIQLPGMDGLEACRLLKADPRTRHIPICVVTGFAMPDDAQRNPAAGFDRYLAKPVQYKDLLAAAQAMTQ